MEIEFTTIFFKPLQSDVAPPCHDGLDCRLLVFSNKTVCLLETLNIFESVITLLRSEYCVVQRCNVQKYFFSTDKLINSHFGLCSFLGFRTSKSKNGTLIGSHCRPSVNTINIEIALRCQSEIYTYNI